MDRKVDERSKIAQSGGYPARCWGLGREREKATNWRVSPLRPTKNC